MLFEGNRGLCPNCDQHSGFKTDATIQVWPSYMNYSRSGFGGSEGITLPVPRTVMRVLSCLHCRQTVTVLDHVTDSETTRVPAYPAMTPRTLDDSVPEVIRSVFTEASKCEQSGAMRAAGVLYRAAVEAMVKNLSGTGNNLYEKIESLRTKLGDQITDDLHEARLLGNDSIHDLLAYAADEVEDVAELIEEAVLHVYVQPQQRAAMRDRRKARRSGGTQS